MPVRKWWKSKDGIELTKIRIEVVVNKREYDYLVKDVKYMEYYSINDILQWCTYEGLLLRIERIDEREKEE